MKLLERGILFFERPMRLLCFLACATVLSSAVFAQRTRSFGDGSIFNKEKTVERTALASEAGTQPTSTFSTNGDLNCKAYSQLGRADNVVGGVKTDVATTRSDLETTKSQLQRVVGDAGVMSGLIATNHSELEILKHKGDRNYVEFTLQKGAKPTLLSTISLQLKKVDNKHGRYTLNVSADDRNIEKKDKGLDEPVQFYTGKDPVLYELVVNSMEKNKVSGYLSTPKGAAR